MFLPVLCLLCLQWAVLQSKEEDGTPRMIFISTKGFSIMYTDPRTGEAIESERRD